jgi:hypothetical protein
VTAPLLFYYLLIPFVYVAFLIYSRVRKTPVEFTGTDAKLMLLCCVGLTLAAGVSGPTALRLNHIAIPGVVILVWLLSQMPHGRRIGIGVLSAVCLIGFAYVVQRQAVPKNYLDMPAGRAAFLSAETYERYKWIGENTKEGDVIFEAQHPSFYFPFHLKNPTPLSVMRDSEYTPRFQVDSVVLALERSRPNLIVWDGIWSKEPGARRAGDNLDSLWQFIQTNYELAVEYPVHGDYTLSSVHEIEFWRLKSRKSN